MDISNRTLGLLLVAVIVISIGGTFISLNRLDGISTTGFATNNETGTVTLNVKEELSITTTDDDVIDFGTCTLNATVGYSNFQSNSTSAQFNSNGNCTGGTDSFPGSADSITIRNNGNEDANISVRINTTGANLFTVGGSPSATSNLQYKTESASTGCSGGDLQATFATFSTEDTDYNACEDLDYGVGTNTMEFFVQAHINASVDSGGPAEVTFEARPVLP